MPQLPDRKPLKRLREDGENDEENVDPKRRKKSDSDRRTDNFLRHELRPLGDITNRPLEPVSRKGNRDDAFGIQEMDYEGGKENRSSKRRLDGLLKETNGSLESVSQKRIEPDEYGIKNAFQTRRMLIKSDALNLHPGSQDTKKGSDALRKLTSDEKKKDQEIVQNIMRTIKSQIGEDRKITLQELPDATQDVVNRQRGEEVSGDIYNEAREELKSMLKNKDLGSILKNLKEQNTKEDPDGSNLKVTPEMLKSIAEKLEEGSKVSDASRSNLDHDFNKLLKDAKQKSKKDSGKSEHEQRKNSINFLQKIWATLFE